MRKLVLLLSLMVVLFSGVMALSSDPPEIEYNIEIVFDYQADFVSDYNFENLIIINTPHEVGTVQLITANTDKTVVIKDFKADLTYLKKDGTVKYNCDSRYNYTKLSEKIARDVDLHVRGQDS